MKTEEESPRNAPRPTRSGKPGTLVVTDAADDELRRHEYDYTKEIDLADYGLSGTLQTESDQMQTRTTDHVATDVDGTITYDYDDTGRLTAAGDSHNDQRDYEYSYPSGTLLNQRDSNGTTNLITEPTGHVIALIDPAAHEVGAYTY